MREIVFLFLQSYPQLCLEIRHIKKLSPVNKKINLCLAVTKIGLFL